jgi:signal transduction histidine kinase
MWWLVGIMLALLWTAGLLLERTATRYIRLQAQQEEQKRLTLIGQMTAVLAHEIRNALASIKGYAQWVNEKTAESEPSKPAMGAILQGTGRIESLVNEILLFSKQETYTIEPVGIARLMDEAAGSGLTGWQGKTEIEIDPGILVMADREKLLRTLVNGIRNAVDAMGGDGALHIGVSAEGRWVTLRIEDSGPGISVEDVPRLFTPFYTTKTEGTGLGLAYAKKVIEGMGGIINLENRKYTQGAILSIKLPAS